MFVPLALVMRGGGPVDGWTGGPVERRPISGDFAVAALTALVLELAFRVWDDIEDRSRDAREHPSRVTVVADSVAPLIAFAIVLGAHRRCARRASVRARATRLAPSARRSRFSARGIGCGLRRRVRVVNGHVVLLKYPRSAFAAIADGAVAGALVSLYLVLCVYEIVDDPSLRASIVARWIAISECALVSVIVATATVARGKDPMTAIATPPHAVTALLPPVAGQFETVCCYLCGGTESSPFITGEDDLTGKPGRFTFVTCARCGLRYQNPRLTVEHIKSYYDDEYIAHRKKKDWGPLTGFFNWAMDRHDREKDKIVSRYVTLDERSDVLDVGCAVGTFLQKMRYAPRRACDRRRLQGPEREPDARRRRLPLRTVLRAGLRREALRPRDDVALPRARLRPDAHAGHGARLLKPDGRLVIEVPRLDSTTFRLYRDRWPGLQAPQHTVLYDRTTFLLAMDKAGLEVVEYLPYGAFPAFFYLFAGAAFKLLRGKGAQPLARDLSRTSWGRSSSRRCWRSRSSSTSRCRRSICRRRV